MQFFHRTNSARRPGIRSAIALLLLVGAPLAAVPASAQIAVKVGVIDVERILLDSERGQAALQEIEALRNRKQQEGQALQDEISQLRQQLQEGQLSLSEERLDGLRREVEDRAVALRRFQEDANRELTKARNEMLADLERSVLPVINQIGQEGGYTLIFNKFDSGLVFADEAVDITQAVIERYDQGADAAAAPEPGGDGG